jgi:hypothetical protein
MPEAILGASLASPSSETSGKTRPRLPDAERGPAPTPPDPVLSPSTSSTIVFHSPQLSQRPAQRAPEAAQFRQMNLEDRLTMTNSHALKKQYKNVLDLYRGVCHKIWRMIHCRPFLLVCAVAKESRP